MKKGFDEEKFMDYIQGEFDGITHFTREMIYNILEYAHEHEQVSKDQFCYFVSDMIPEMEFGEVAMFMEDKCLTQDGIEAKREYLNLQDEKKSIICPSCGVEMTMLKCDIEEDEMGKFYRCPNCESTFNIEEE